MDEFDSYAEENLKKVSKLFCHGLNKQLEVCCCTESAVF